MNVYAETTAAHSGVPYPVHLEIDPQAEYPRWTIFAGLLAIPHFMALVVLGIAAAFVAIGSWFAVLFTGRYPEGMFKFMVGVSRWSYRVLAFTFMMTSQYPPFSLEDDPAYPVRFNVDYPTQGIARWRALVHWLLVIPFSIAAAAISYVAYLLLFIPWFSILFTKHYPKGLFDFNLVALRWHARGSAYSSLMVDRYPPFAWE